MITPIIKKMIEENNIVVLSSVDTKNQPRSILVEANKVEKDTIIITDNQMVKTRSNILKNPKVFIVAFKPDYSISYKITGEAKYYTKGKIFDYIKTLETNRNRKPKGVVVVTAKNITLTK